MNTTAAATQAGVTTPTIRTWCRVGAVAAVKRAGRWVIDAASLAHRLAIGVMKAARPAPHSRELDIAIGQEIAQASYCGTAASLRHALSYVEDRNASAFIGATTARIPESQWAEIAALLAREIANLDSERRTQRAVYDYS